MYKPHMICRACGYGKNPTPGSKSLPTQEKLVKVVDLGLQPLANDFCREGQERAGFAPLEVLYCPRCTLAQLSVVVKPEILYANYKYVTSPSATMQAHFEQLVNDLSTEKPDGQSVIEIGSNDGLFLSYLQSRGYGNIAGIDPAENLAHKTSAPTIIGFFTEKTAVSARAMVGKVDFIIARHVFCHVDDWAGFFAGITAIADKETLVCIEVPWAIDTLACGQFDQFYHEHLSYLTLRALETFLNTTQFHMHRVIHYPVHGGALLIMIRRNDSVSPIDPALCIEERSDLDTWRKFGTRCDYSIHQLAEMVKDLGSKGKTVVGYGASAKSTVWVNACKFNRRYVRFICDETIDKQYCVSPGTDIPIVDPGALTRELPDYAILFAWNYQTEIISKEKIFREKGGKWIVPVPEPHVIFETDQPA